MTGLVAGPGVCVMFPAGSTTSLTISCANHGLGDLAFPPILANISTTAAIDTFDFSNNTLTAVPSGLPQFTTVVNLNVASNQITSVGATELQFTANVSLVDLSSNQIKSIEPGAFPGSLLTTFLFYFNFLLIF